MSGTTASIALPYPTDSDLVADGPATIQALADALDARLRPAMMRRGIPAASLPTIPNAAVTDVAWPTLIDTEGPITYQNAKEIRIDLAGRYDVTAAIRFAAAGTGRRALTVYLNGTTAIVDAEAAPGTTALVSVLAHTTDVELVAGDVLKVGAYQDSGAGRAFVGDLSSNYFTVTRRPS